MRNFIRYFLLIGLFLFAVPQTGGAQTGDVLRVDSRTSQADFVPGVILIKFKDAVATRLGKTNGISTLGVSGIDALMQKYQIAAAQKLFPGARQLTHKRQFKTYSGTSIEQPSLHNIFKMEIAESNRLFEAIEELKRDQNVEYAEPNYILSIVNDKPASDILTAEDVGRLQKTAAILPNDPLYSQQWYIPAVHADAAWDSTKGDSTQIIAILDTGVDWLHPDLKNKIWINQAEANGIPGVDDDGNGFVDDMRGWDYINDDNNPTDDNSHGTHVAGIAAAEADNGIGIAGVNWYAKILPIKVFQSSGRGDVATITQGIVYAADKGATVINMSFGTYARSLTMEAALASAYANTILVAAAGNDGLCIGPNKCSDLRPGQPFYPAALSYVLGVQAGDAMGPEGFSNYDPDGSTFSGYADLLNYELKAPGGGVLSTVPNGNYRVYAGTSMAAPIASGAVALYKNLKPDDSQEMMWGNLINTTGSQIDIFSAISVRGNPKLNFVSNKIVDTLPGGNANGEVDAGELLQLLFTVRNTWARSDSVFLGLRLGEFEDTSVAHIVNPTAFVGSISSYAKRTNETHPFEIQISPQVVHDRNIVLEGLAWYAGATDTVRQRVVLIANHGQYLPGGIIDSTIVLTPDREWILNQSLKFTSNGGLIILPGTTVYLTQSLSGVKRAVGTQDSIIRLIGNGTVTMSGDTFHYCSIERFSHVNGAFSNCSLNQINNPLSDGIGAIGGTLQYCAVGNSISYYSVLNCSSVKNSVIMNSKSLFYFTKNGVESFEKNNVVNCWSNYFGGIIPAVMQHNNFINVEGGKDGPSVFFGGFFRDADGIASLANQRHNNIIRSKNIIEAPTGADIISLDSTYWGTSDLSVMRNSVYDFWDDVNFSMYDFGGFLQSPDDSAHGIVWKVLVDGIDPQDEKSLLNPIGVGSHRFDVYFNRPMDTTETPQVSFGVREPFTQQSVADSGRWSFDHKIWTAYKTVKLSTGDGINRIRVTGARDLENFEIPVEDLRFEFVVDAAGSASTEFTANPGLGKINLEWNNAGLSDLLGFNMYRFTNVTDTTYSDTTLINSTLVTDTAYTDYEVIPGKNYYYKYKVVRTDFSETDYSRTVGAKALTSSPGDANGDLTVNVLDVVSTVSYILGQPPQPFIYVAADINNDTTINVLDIVGIINIILHPTPAPGLQKTATGIARLYVNENKITLTSDVAVTAIQFRLEGKGLKDVQFVPDASIAQFEVASNTIGDSVKIVIIYNITGAALAQGSTTVGSLPSLPSNVKLTEGIVADRQGKNILTNIYDNGTALVPEEYYLSQNYPNPFNMSTKIQFGLPERAKARMVIYNVLGQRVRVLDLGDRVPGRYEITWDGLNETGKIVSSGVYFYRFETGKFIQTKKLLLIK